MKKKVKDIRPGIRIPTAKGSIKFKSKKDYNRKKRQLCVCGQWLDECVDCPYGPPYD